jgi:lysophospholipase L1-like esterase
VTLVCLGDSTTAGTPYFESPIEAPPDGRGDETGSFPYWLRQLHPDWTVLNRGVNGERSDQIAARFDRDVLLHRPDAVTILAGVNDVYQNRAAADVVVQLEGMFRRALDAGILVVAGTIVPYDTATAAQNGAMRAINAWIAARAAGAPQVLCADTRAAAAAASNPDRLSGSPDGLHPDREGYRRMAEAIERVIRNRV